MNKLEGKIAVITGGNSGIGLATAKKFAEEGAHIYITGRRQAELDRAVKEMGNSVIGVQGDVSSLADLDRLYATVKKQEGQIDVLFANAGLGEFSPLETISEAHIDKTFTINVRGLVFTVQKALPLFRDGGSIILNASIAAYKPIDGFSIYSATKGRLCDHLLALGPRAERSVRFVSTPSVLDRSIHQASVQVLVPWGLVRSRSRPIWRRYPIGSYG